MCEMNYQKSEKTECMKKGHLVSLNYLVLQLSSATMHLYVLGSNPGTRGSVVINIW